jgi:hypothetical protein
MALIGPKTHAAMEKIAATKSSIKASKGAIEKLEVLKREMRKEQEDREAKGTRDERAEEGCRWQVCLLIIVSADPLADGLASRITNATALYSSLLGIRSAYAIGSPPSEMIIEYDRSEGDFRTLSISFGQDGRMAGAKVCPSPSPVFQYQYTLPQLVDSSDDIQDIVEAYLPSQDMRSLVQEVRARIAR